MSAPVRQGVAVRIARWSAAHPWQAILGWIGFVVLSVGIGAAVGTNQASGRDFWVGEAGVAESIADRGQLTQPPQERVLITSATGGPAGEAADRAATDVAARLASTAGVDHVLPVQHSADGTAVLVSFTLQGDAKAATAKLPPIEAQVAAAQAAHPGVTLAQTGTASTSKGNGKQLGADLSRAEMITFPVTLAILFVVFGALLAAAVPLILAISAVGSALGLYSLTSLVFPDAGGAVANVVLLMGMAVGVDYSLFYLERAREERARSSGRLTHVQAVELAAVTSGHTILVSGAAVLLSLIGLYFADDVIFSSIASGSIIVVLMAMVGSLTALPALLAKLGGRVDRRRVRRRGVESISEAPGRAWSSLLRPATRRPRLTLLIAAGAMVLLALPAFGIRLRVEGNDTFPRVIPAIAAYDRMTRSFPTEGVAHLVAVEAPAGRRDAVRAALVQLAARAGADAHFARPDQPRIRTSSDGTVATLELPIPTGTNAPASADSLRMLRDTLLPATVGQVQGARYAVSGQVARSIDYVEHQGSRTPAIVLFVLAVTFVMMSVAFRSVVIGLLGVALNVLSAAAAFGALVVVFQWLRTDGFITSRIPLILFVILFGLSMDYQVFVVSRIRERVQAGLSTRDAVTDGITRSAGVVTSAAVVMVSVFVSFLFVGLLELKQIGFGLAAAVIMDAVIVRILMLPAALTLLGSRSWWPSRPPAAVAPAARSGVEHRVR
ncbi:MMPL family transporter [Dactylosporangium sp. NPDC051485]|uniref:MMPL family transporter n=1 Tax=Dactylosporangium sp. NPDC051485 TaxID=3154846 RepID=UPI0034191640